MWELRKTICQEVINLRRILITYRLIYFSSFFLLQTPLGTHLFYIIFRVSVFLWKHKATYEFLGVVSFQGGPDPLPPPLWISSCIKLVLFSYPSVKTRVLGAHCSKCEFLKAKVNYLGNVVSEEGIHAEKGKLETVPKNIG